MRTYGQFCPVAQALEILAERWTLLVVRELLEGSSRFSEIRRGVPLISRTLLSQRLRTLTDAGIVDREDGEDGPSYHLTEAGAQLRPIVEHIGVWGKRYVTGDLRDEHLDPKLLMWDLQRRLHVERLPERKTVVLFRLHDSQSGESRFWLHLERPEVDLCLTSEGFEPDLVVECELRALTEVWLGQRPLKDAIRQGTVRLEGPAPLQKAFPAWLKLSVFAGA